MDFVSRPTSSAIKIVDPSTRSELPSPRAKDSVQRQCRNILLHGYCKNRDKGCMFAHPPFDDEPLTRPRSLSPIAKTLTADALNAPVFVPKAVPPQSFSPPSDFSSTPPPLLSDSNDSYGYYNQPDEQLDARMADVHLASYDDQQYLPYTSEYGQEVPYYPVAPVFERQPLNYHLYTPTRNTASRNENHFVPSTSEHRQLLLQRSETIRGTPPAGLMLPEEVFGYHTLVPLDIPVQTNERRRFVSWYTSVYRGVNSADGIPYALRRIEGFRLMKQAAFSTMEFWSKFRHPGVVALREAFTTRSFDDSSLVVVYAYHADSRTLAEAHFKGKDGAQSAFPMRFSHMHANTGIPERVVWSYIVQLASAIKAVHDAGHAVRVLDLHRILVTGKNRVRINSCGIIDVLLHDTPQDTSVLQQEDLHMFGRIVFALCTGNPTAASAGHFQKSLDIIGRNYNSDIKNVALFLIGKTGPHRTIGQLLDIIGSRVVIELDDALTATDLLQHSLMGELENARLVRLLCKFNFINERPEFARDPRWSETGDRYILKLFRDYVFHQVDEHGKPVVNLSHVLTCLNKLDAGTDERVMLTSRDEQSCLVVSYKEIKSCLETSFGELVT